MPIFTPISSDFPVFYFGCIETPIHRFWLRPGAALSSPREASPWGWGLEDLVPKGFAVGRVCGTYESGWTALAFRDNSVYPDLEGVSVFLTPMPVSSARLLQAAKVQWTGVFLRLEFPLVGVPGSSAEVPA